MGEIGYAIISGGCLFVGMYTLLGLKGKKSMGPYCMINHVKRIREEREGSNGVTSYDLVPTLMISGGGLSYG